MSIKKRVNLSKHLLCLRPYLRLSFDLVKTATVVALLLSFHACSKNPTRSDPPDPLNKILFISITDSFASSGLFTMKPDGTDIKKLTADEISYLDACWSPDMTRIAASGMPNLAPPQMPEWFEIYMLDSLGNHLYRLTWNGHYPVWSPDGKRIIFERQGPVGNYAGLYMINADGTGEYPLDIDYSSSILHVWDWSNDGQRLLTTAVKYVEGSSRPVSYELYEMDLGGNLKKQITDTDDIMEYDAKWSPDNSKITFSTIGLYRDIYVMNADGTGLKIITPAGENKIEAFRWSPDGSMVAFGWAKEIGSFESRREWADIFTINTDGTGSTRITDVDSTNNINRVTDWR